MRGVLKKVRANFPFWLDKLPEMPDLIYHALTQPTPPPATPTKIVDNKFSGFSWGVGMTLIVISGLHLFFYMNKLPVIIMMTISLILLVVGYIKKDG